MKKRPEVKFDNILPFLIIGIEILLLFFLIWHTNLVISSDDIVKINKFTLNGEKDDLHYRLLEIDSPEHYTFEARVSADKLKMLKGDIYKLLIIRLSSRWYKIYFNDILIGSLGDTVNNKSNIWNAIGIYDLDPSLIRKNNIIKLELFASYEMGMDTPLLITDISDCYNISTWYSLLSKKIVIIAISFIIFGFTMMMFIYFRARNIKKEYLYYALAGLFMSLSLVNSFDLQVLPFSYLVFKKIFNILPFIATFFMSKGLYHQFHIKFSFLSYLTLACSVLLFFLPGHQFFYTIKYLSIILLMNLLSWLYISYKFYKTSTYAQIILYTSFYFVISFMCDMYFPSGKIHNIVFLFSGVFIFSITILFFLIMEYAGFQKEIFTHRKMTELLYDRAIKDGMTGTYNHEYIANTLEKLQKDYVIIIMDIDNFKEVNDTYGHQAGDIVIKQVAEGIKNNVRASDIVGRYGGDEFIIVLFDCSEDEATRVAIKIKKAIEGIHKLNNFDIDITVSIGIYISEKGEPGDEALYKADKALYYVKEHGKNSIKMYKG